MEDVKGSRVVVVDEKTGDTTTKTTAQIVKENEELSRKMIMQKQAALKQGIRENVFSKPKPKESEEKSIVEVGESSSTKSEKEVSMVEGKRHVSLKFGVVGSGQAGGRIAEVFANYGYAACAINTAQQDLEFLALPEEDKYLIDNKELGGTGKDLDISLSCFEEQEDQIRDFIDDKVGSAEALILAVSAGGGTGAGSAEILCNWLYDMGKPVIVIYILPGSFDDAQSKHNAITVLDRLGNLASRQIISSLILVDNTNIELSFPNLSQAAFFKTANKAVVDPLHMFNTVSVTPTEYESLDSLDFTKSLLDSGNCSVFGTNTVPSEWYEEDETALMEAVIEGLDGGLLASGFDLNEAQTVGILVTARQSVLEKISYTSISYMFKYISDEFGSTKSFKGVYAVPAENDDITIRFIFSGMGLPKERVASLKAEAAHHMNVLAKKKTNTSMKVGLNKDKASSEIDRNINKLKKKKSAIGKLLGGGGKKPRRRR